MASNPDIASFHTPEVLAPEVCVERCAGLAKCVGEATLAAATSPNEQFVVICHTAKKLGCSAATFSEGTYTEIDGTEVLFPLFTRTWGGKRGSDVHSAREIAEGNGAVQVPLDTFHKRVDALSREVK
jgi:hypothetical protein